MQMPVFLLLFFAPVYVPLALLQGWIHDVATYNPITRVLEAGRGFLAGSPTEVGLAFARRRGARASPSRSGRYAACEAPSTRAKEGSRPRFPGPILRGSRYPAASGERRAQRPADEPTPSVVARPHRPFGRRGRPLVGGRVEAPVPRLVVPGAVRRTRSLARRRARRADRDRARDRRPPARRRPGRCGRRRRPRSALRRRARERARPRGPPAPLRVLRRQGAQHRPPSRPRRSLHRDRCVRRVRGRRGRPAVQRRARLRGTRRPRRSPCSCSGGARARALPPGRRADDAARARRRPRARRGGPAVGDVAPELDGLTRRRGRARRLLQPRLPPLPRDRAGRSGVRARGNAGADRVRERGARRLRALGRPGTPFLVHVVDGFVAAKGTVNSLEQLDGLVALGGARMEHAPA